MKVNVINKKKKILFRIAASSIYYKKACKN